MSCLTVYLTGGTDESANNIVQSFINSCEELENYDHIDIKIIRGSDIPSNEKTSGQSKELSAAVALEKIIANYANENTKGKKKDTHHRPVKVIILHDYPKTDLELLELTNSTFKYPLLDAVVRIVNKTGAEVVSSEGGPESTIQKNPPGYRSRAGSAQPYPKDLCEIDITQFLKSNYDKHAGHITMDDILAVKSGETGDPVSLEFSELLEEFTALCTSLYESKSGFHSWASLTHTIDVKLDNKALKRIQLANSQIALNNMNGVWKTEPLYSAYRGYMNLLPTEVQTATGVLFSVVQSIVHLSLEHQEEEVALGLCNKPSAIGLKDVQLPPGTTGSLQQSFSDSLLIGLIREPIQDDRSPKNLLVLDDGDKCGIKAVKASRYTAGTNPAGPDINDTESATTAAEVEDSTISVMVKGACAELMNFESNTIYRAQVPRLLGQGGIPLHSTYSKTERSILETELLTFSSLSSSDLHRNNILQAFEKMVERIMPKLPNFTGQKIGDSMGDLSITKRQYFRHISGFTLPQILAKDLCTEPVVIREYYPLTDQLLLAFLWLAPDRRMGKKEWTPRMNMRTKPTFDEYRVLEETQNFTPRTASGLKYSINITSAEIEKYHQHTTVITPSDKSIVQLKYLNSTKECWISMYVKDSLIGLRTQSKLDDSRRKSAQISSDKENAELEVDAETAADFGGVFFCNTDDDVRITASAEGVASDEIKKPDHKCFVRVGMTFVNGAAVVVNTNGVISITPPNPIQTPKGTDIKENGEVRTPFGFEYFRHICAGGIVVRHIGADYIYGRDLLFADGTRILVRAERPPEEEKKKKLKKMTTKKMSKAQSSMMKKSSVLEPEEPVEIEKEKECKETFLAALLKEAPPEWKYVKLGVDGDISFFTGSLGSPVDGVNNTEVPCDKFSNIKKNFVDAETRSVVAEYRDGRVATQWSDDDIRELRFPDGTRMITHLAQNIVFIEKPTFPSIEIDVEIDRVSKKHSLGLQVPIALGGERVRSRVAMPDGSAIFVKYNTKVTAQYNGSIKVVRRNREIIVVEDGGIVTYFPPSAWSSESAEEFEADCSDRARRREGAGSNRMLQSQSKPKEKKLRFKGSNMSSAVEAPLSTRSNRSTSSKKSARSSAKSPVSGSKVNSVTLSDDDMERSQCSSVDSGSADSLDSISKLANRKVDHTKYVFNVRRLSCHIEDNENNVFDLDYFDPEHPRVSLAGEVEGLKPKAITETSLEPRMYIVDRHANAIEVARVQDIIDVEGQVASSEDASKYVSDAISPPCDLGGSKIFTYFTRRRMGGEDCYTFSEIFCNRYWHDYERPTAASIVIDKLKKKHSEDKTLYYPKVYESRSYIEYPPLSSAGFNDLEDALKRWNDWRYKRNTEIDRFRTVDPRTEEDLKTEKDISTKLKKAYKAARVMASKKREKEKEKAAANAKPTNLDLSRIHEDLEDIPEFSDDEYDEEEEFVEDPENIEIRECFENHCVQYDDSSRLPIENLRSALVQIFNRFVTESEINKALADDVYDGVSSNESSSLSIEEFRRLYFTLKGPEGIPITQPDQMEVHEEVSYSTVSQEANVFPNKTVPAVRNFWQTSSGLRASAKLEESQDENVTYAIEDMGDEYVSGSALHAVRRGASKTYSQ